MKREALGNTKMKRLCRHLGIRMYAAVGLLESLWHLTAKEAPQGNIGKISNEDIACGVDWDGDEDELIEALVDAKWLDRSSQYRLVVHDWHEHADDAVDNKLARAGLVYANGAMPRMRRLSVRERESAKVHYEHKEVRAHAVHTPCALPEPEPEPEPVNIFPASSDAQDANLPAEAEKPEQAFSQRRESLEQQEQWFTLFWDKYWRKKDRIPAQKQFKRLIRDQTAFDGLMRAVERDTPMMLKRKAQTGDDSLIPYPERYLKGQPWEDGEGDQELSAPIPINQEKKAARWRDLDYYKEQVQPLQRSTEEIALLQEQAQDADPVIRNAARLVLGMDLQEASSWKN
jgi:hypothetical protein